MPSESLIKYGSFDIDQAKKEREEIDSGGGEFMKLKVGRNVCRILPPPVGKRTPFRTIFQHFIELPNGQKAVFVCPRIEARKPCPACKKADALKSTGKKIDADAADNYFARRRVFCNVIDRAEEEKGPKPLAFGKKIYDQLIALREDEDAGIDYTHPLKGYDLVFKRTGQTKNDTSYKVIAVKEASPVTDDVALLNEWIESQKNLEVYAQTLSWEAMVAKINGEEEDDAPAPRRSSGAVARAAGFGAPKKARRAVDDVIDVDGESIEVDEDEED